MLSPFFLSTPPPPSGHSRAKWSPPQFVVQEEALARILHSPRAGGRTTHHCGFGESVVYIGRRGHGEGINDVRGVLDGRRELPAKTIAIFERGCEEEGRRERTGPYGRRRRVNRPKWLDPKAFGHTTCRHMSWSVRGAVSKGFLTTLGAPVLAAHRIFPHAVHVQVTCVTFRAERDSVRVRCDRPPRSGRNWRHHMRGVLHSLAHALHSEFVLGAPVPGKGCVLRGAR